MLSIEDAGKTPGGVDADPGAPRWGNSLLSLLVSLRRALQHDSHIAAKHGINLGIYTVNHKNVTFYF